HVLAVQGHAVSMFAEIVVAPGCAVATDDVDFAVRMAEARHQVVQKIKFRHIVIFFIAGAMIAQKTVKLRDGIGEVTVPDTVNHSNPLAGMEWVERKTILLRADWRIRARGA